MKTMKKKNENKKKQIPHDEVMNYVIEDEFCETLEESILLKELDQEPE
jgi:hypothetical protein